MKIYRFDPDTGFYLGEDFADEKVTIKKHFVVPPDATTDPPPFISSGEIAVFNVVERRWLRRSVPLAHCREPEKR